MTVGMEALKIAGVLRFTPRAFADERGVFFESWRAKEYSDAGVSEPFLQDNISISRRHVLRGLHYQVRHAQGQMVSIVRGRVLDVLADLRVGSPTFRETIAVELDESSPTQLYMPPGVAHGFCVLSDEAVLHYKCTRYYDHNVERGVHWADPELAIPWPVDRPIVSKRDEAFPGLKYISPADLPTYS